MVKEGKTFWWTAGGLPSYDIAKSKPSRTAPMTFRVDCDRGKIVALVKLDGAPRIWEHECASGLLSQPLGTVEAGTKIEITFEGTAGTSYAADIRWP
ncbi:hypothetical protein [Pilimelia anulata]|uniref:hypothetical protein n=1 Tax=Pilimelia anulata TaxID=53371 RepID=UPI00166D26BC|nr:hypothetical protein [Pilimelia anulata]